MKAKKNKPQIVEATDLVHLNEQQRINLLGPKNFQMRRKFLKDLLGTAAYISLSSFVLEACTKKDDNTQNISDKTCTDKTCTDKTPTDTTKACSCESYTAPVVCACETNVISAAPTVTNTIPKDGDKMKGIAYVQFDFSKAMDKTSVINSFSISPKPDLYSTPCYVIWENGDKTVKMDTCGQNVPEGGQLTFTLDGTAKSLDGYFLNETEKHNGGTSVKFSIIYGDETCPCVADVCTCESHVNCTCQNNSCPCQSNCSSNVTCPNYGGCLCEVQCGCQMYRV